MNFKHKHWLTILALALGMGLSSSALAAPPFWEKCWLPEGVCTYDKDIDALFYGILILTGFVFLVTEVVLLAFMVMYRKKEGQKSYYTHGNHKLEMIWTITPAVILIFIALVQAKTWNIIKDPHTFMSHAADEKTVNVQLFCKQFSWFFRYPDAQGKFGTEENVITEKNLVVPVNTAVIVEQTSADVIHSFFLPYMRLKQDAVPGMQIHCWFDATKTTAQMRETRPTMTMLNPRGILEEKTWDYPIACAELCGIQHYQMAGKVTVLTQPEYEKWLENERKQFKDGKAEPEPMLFDKYWKVDPKTQQRIYGGESENSRTAFKTPYAVLHPEVLKHAHGGAEHEGAGEEKTKAH